nr:glycosyltransferase family 29 protein [Rubellimicrobium mesophilum]
MGDEAALMRLSDSPEALFAELEGRRVALVGNARSLAERAEGAEIDGAELVIRLNAAPLPSPVSHGTRTDWMAVSVPVEDGVIEERRPRRVLWMTPKRKRLPWRIARRPGFALAPAEWNARLAAELGARPTTGAMVIDLLARSGARGVRLHGFDFFASLSLSGGRTAKDVPHDFGAEKAWVERLAERDGRFVL